eukprot:3603684-Prymnesium_polylepis.2
MPRRVVSWMPATMTATPRAVAPARKPKPPTPMRMPSPAKRGPFSDCMHAEMMAGWRTASRTAGSVVNKLVSGPSSAIWRPEKATDCAVTPPDAQGTTVDRKGDHNQLCKCVHRGRGGAMSSPARVATEEEQPGSSVSGHYTAQSDHMISRSATARARSVPSLDMAAGTMVAPVACIASITTTPREYICGHKDAAPRSRPRGRTSPIHWSQPPRTQEPDQFGCKCKSPSAASTKPSASRLRGSESFSGGPTWLVIE